MQRKIILIVAVIAGLLVFSAPVSQAQQQFSPSDLAGDWVVFLYGAYETKTEHMYGICRINELGMITAGTNTYRGVENEFRGGMLTISPEGVVTGNVILEAWRIELKFLWSRMNMAKSEITGMVEGQWYAGLIRLIKAGGTPVSGG